MKLQKTMLVATSAAVFSLLFAATACKKTTAPPSNAASQTSPAFSPEELKQQRLAWNLKTLVEPYEHAGFANPQWDASAKLALTEFAHVRANVLETNEPWCLIIATNAAAAVQAGCKDPMVTYLYIKCAMDQTNSKEAFAEAFIAVAKEIQKSSYPDMRKFYAALRAVEQFTLANNYPTNWPSEIKGLHDQAKASLKTVLEDKTTPSDEAYDASSQFLEPEQWDKNAYADLYNNFVAPPLFKNWPNASTSWLLKGQIYLQMAWLARGGGYANIVKAEGWKLFAEHLTTAETSLKKAWQINSNDKRIPTIMIRVDEGQQKNRDDMELWFDRAMALDPNNYEACKNKLHYLDPQWYGSREEMIAFGKQCVAATNWGGFVPMILVDAHTDYNTYSQDSDEAKQAYWKQPGVWPDIKAAYDRFFELNSNATDIYKNYAWYAYHAEQWNAFNELVPKVRPADYNFFGGTDKFNKMVQLAKEHAGKPK